LIQNSLLNGPAKIVLHPFYVSVSRAKTTECIAAIYW